MFRPRDTTPRSGGHCIQSEGHCIQSEGHYAQRRIPSIREPHSGENCPQCAMRGWTSRPPDSPFSFVLRSRRSRRPPTKATTAGFGSAPNRGGGSSSAEPRPGRTQMWRAGSSRASHAFWARSRTRTWPARRRVELALDSRGISSGFLELRQSARAGLEPRRTSAGVRMIRLRFVGPGLRADADLLGGTGHRDRPASADQASGAENRAERARSPRNARQRTLAPRVGPHSPPDKSPIRYIM